LTLQNIEIIGSNENNLKNIDLIIPKNKLTVITGVSGSGKSSIVYDTLYRESQRLYFSTFPAWKRAASRFSSPKVKSIRGINATIAIDQKAFISNIRSTVGTFSGIYDLLRLLFSRFGNYPETFNEYQELFISSKTITRSLFSFNSTIGACQSCRGHGVEDFIDPELIVKDWSLSLRDRALRITAPNGYIIYSQVTLDVLDLVCREHGFSVDTPLCDLSKDQLNVLFYGSDKILVPFGKHTLESRMKWTGIKAKPREEGHYRGFINVMLEILKRDRNKNILRFATSRDCSKCKGTRLVSQALEVTFFGKNIAELSNFDLQELFAFFKSVKDPKNAKELINEIVETLSALINTGLSHLKISRSTNTLSSGEVQRIRIASLMRSSLTGVTFILDEPTVGLHRSEAEVVINLLKRLRDNGNTVIVVEHDIDTILAADHIVETGPVGGIEGGHILFSGDLDDFVACNDLSNSPTWLAIKDNKNINSKELRNKDDLTIKGSDLSIKLGALNVIAGPGGSGKRTLLSTIKKTLEVYKTNNVKIDRSPIGKTPRSNPATYTGISENIRDLFSKLTESKDLELTKSSFSFNTKGGRCEVCEGAGVIEVGMKHFGAISLTCERCKGRRFNNEVLKASYNGLSISDIYDLSINQAAEFFRDQPKILRTLNTMIDLGIGYLKLGQPSSTLSGGEAQRIKLSSYLCKNIKETVFLFEEPTTGLHPLDVKKLLKTLQALSSSGNTAVAIEHDPDFIISCDHIIELFGKPENNFKNTVFQGPAKLLLTSNTLTGKVIKNYVSRNLWTPSEGAFRTEKTLKLNGINTNNLKNIDLSVTKGKFTVVTGVSGSGKSSLIFDTLFSKSMGSFLDGFSPYFRSLFKTSAYSVIKSSNLMAPIAVSEKFVSVNSRSTAATASGIWEILRMLFSRTGKINGQDCGFSAGDFSFNSASGACLACEGKGTIPQADIEKIITDPDKSFIEGALLGTTPGKYFGDINGQFIHTLKTVGHEFDIDFSKPVKELDNNALDLALNGSGIKEFKVTWNYSRGNRTGTHEFVGAWPGFINLYTEEYTKAIGNKNESKLYSLMKEVPCSHCNGFRLRNELLEVVIGSKNVSQIINMTIFELIDFIDKSSFDLKKEKAVTDLLFAQLTPLLKTLDDLGLSHLNLNRSVSDLSLGERERLKLVKLSSSSLTDILYIIDEPSRGIHPTDSKKVVSLIRSLTEKGNTVVAVEHEPSIIKMADQIIEMGPGAGENGGEIIFNGTFKDLLRLNLPTSRAFTTDKYLKQPFTGKMLTIDHPGILNIKELSCHIALSGLNVITGVSGSGKTTLLKKIIVNELKDKTVLFHENLINSGGSNSTVATFTKLKDAVKRLISKSSDLKNIWTDSTCKTCKGTGSVKIPMDHLCDPVIQCSDCEGTGFKNKVLNIKYKESNIADILSMTVEQAAEFLSENIKITSALRLLQDCGLQYLRLNQNFRSLSSGEKQRLALATDLNVFTNIKDVSEKFFIFDEPSTGLHFDDIKGFLALFKNLTDNGATVVCAEHRMQIVSQADHIIDLGPGSGENGGNVVFEGPVNDLISAKTKTGEALSDYLKME